MSREFDQPESGLDAIYDQLTGLPNRAFFDASLEAAIASTPGNFGVLFIDLDRLKSTNDSQGHQAGDELIAGAADRLKQRFRQIEAGRAEPDVIARLSGDEFGVIIRYVYGPLFLHLVATRTQEDLDAGGIRASVGAALHNANETAGSLLARADAAMYENKNFRRLSRFMPEQLGAIATIEEIADKYNLDIRDVASAIEVARRKRPKA